MRRPGTLARPVRCVTVGSPGSWSPRAFAALVLSSVFILSSVFSEMRAGAEAPTTTEAINSISGSRIMGTIQDLQELGSRAFYLNSSQDAASYIHGRFEALNIDVAYQEFTVGTHIVKNVIGTVPGTSKTAPDFLFGAHYDSENKDARNFSDGQRLAAPGADDDASGVASVTELARIVAGLRLRNTVKFVAFGAEEYGYDDSGGLAGSLEFVQSEKALGVSYAGCWIVDMIGYRGGSGNHTAVMVNGDSDALGSWFQEAVRRHEIQLAVEVERNSSVTYSDHSRFWAAGYPAALVIESDPAQTTYQFNPYYHSPNDTLDKLSEGQMTSVTEGLLATLLDMTAPGGADERTITLTAGAIAAASAVVVCIYFMKRKVRVE